MKIKTPQDTSNLTDLALYSRYTSQVVSLLVDALNGNLTFGENLLSELVEVDFTTANSSLIVKHGLGVVPTGYVVVSKPKSLDVYDGVDAFTTESISLISTQIAKVQVMILV